MNYRAYKTTNRWHSVDGYFDVFSIQPLLPSIIVCSLIWLYWLSFRVIETRPCGKAERCISLALFTLTQLKMMYHAKWILVLAIHLFMNRYSQAADRSPIIYLSLQLSVKLHKAGEPLTHSVLLVFPTLFLCVSTALTVSKTISDSVFDFPFGRTNPGTIVAALTTCGSAHSGSSMQLLFTILDSSSTSESSSQSFALAKSPFQVSQSSVSTMLSGTLFSSLSTGWRLILQIRLTFKIWFRPPGKPFAEKAPAKGDLSANFDAAAPSCWKSDQDALTISAISEMYPMVVLCSFCARDFFWVEHMFWHPCHISNKLCTLAILGNLLSSASFCISESFSVFVVSNSGSVPAKIPVLARANCLTITFSPRVSPVVFECFQPITCRPREQLASTPTPCDMIEDMSRATLQRSEYFECVSSFYRHQSGMSGIQNVMLISTGSERYSLIFGLLCSLFSGASGGEFK